MDFETTYYMGEAFTRGAFRVSEVGNAIGLKNRALTNGTWTPTEPLRFRQYEGRTLYDCIGSQNATLMVSEKVIATLRDVNATGWDTYPIILETKGGSEVKGYSGLMVRGRCRAIDNSRSVQIEKVVSGNPKGARVWKGLFFDEASWDGSDVFCPTGTGYSFITEKVRIAFDRANITNFSYTALVNFERAMLF